MWYEILPSFGIIVAAMGLPHFSTYVFNKLVNGNAYKRYLVEDSSLYHYVRDHRLTGDTYKVQGLEAIPDE